MQVRKQYLPVTAKYESLFNKSTKTNRVELVSDFPKGNEAEVVSSLQVCFFFKLKRMNWKSILNKQFSDSSPRLVCP